MEHLSCDVLIVGSGAAGLRAAISAREAGLDVCVISKGTPGKATCTILSGGVFAGVPEANGPEDHIARTLQAGRGINQKELVEILAREGPKRLKELMAWGIKGEFHRGYLFAKGRPPVWGEAIVLCLLTRAKAMGVRFIGGMAVSSLRVLQGAAGVVANSAVRDKWLILTAKAVILATGGAGALYLRHDNPQRMIGEGYAIALDAGAQLQDMEFVQFYPLGSAEPKFPPLVIPPRLADRGRLFNRDKEDILEKYDIKERPAAERARDRLSQALFREIILDKRDVWLDLQGISKKEWCSDPFSASTWDVLGKRYGARYRPIRISPMAHHVMGGVCIDTDGATSVPGLFAAGEVTGGLHGANRLGGNALTETQVFGARAGAAAAACAQRSTTRRGKELIQELALPLFGPKTGRTASSISELKKRLRHIMWEKGGIIRDREGLSHALSAVREIHAEAMGLPAADDPLVLQRGLELRYAARVATLILESALKREESRGAHFREDFPEQDDNRWLGHLRIRKPLSEKQGPQTFDFHPIS
jgi:fumarate reductase (CoM/CoB) subunit A